jgi:hypothetical protein
MRPARVRLTLLVAAFVLSLSGGATGQALATKETPLAKEQIRQFLLKADIIRSREIGKGVTGGLRLTLSDGQLTHDAAFITVDERKTTMNFSKGGTEFNFVDSYHYNIAAYGLAELLGLDDMMPVMVERAYQSRRGSLSWWISDAMEESERLKRKLNPPDPLAWNKQMYRMRVFAKLVQDTDRNLGNVMFTPDWKLWMIDFTRAFRLRKTLDKTADLTRCERRLLDALRALTKEQVKERTSPHLNEWEIDAVLARRDLIVEHFEQLVAQKGEAVVLY